MTIPPLSDEQRQQARTAATEARRRRAEVKKSLRRGETTLAEVLAVAERDEVVAHAKVVDVLKSLPRVGAVRAGKVMHRLDIAPNRRLRGLGIHQTAALIAEFSAGDTSPETSPPPPS
ncbi:MAG TPA: integration host factor, actinobacterial type [Propionibacteriaceae bacterium]|nr:integration host factor, actinobacterial type [Propionibacteriaceae bacterium]